MPGRSAQPLCAARRRNTSLSLYIRALVELIWERNRSQRKASPANNGVIRLSPRCTIDRGRLSAREGPAHSNDASTPLQHLPMMQTTHSRRLACKGQPVVGRSPRPVVQGRECESNPARAGWRRRAVRCRFGRSSILGDIRFGQPLMHSVRITNRWSGPGQRALLGR